MRNATMTRPLNSTLVRTLQNLERLLVDHDRRLADLDCEDPGTCPPGFASDPAPESGDEI